MLQVLATYYREFGCGKLGRYNAFRWDNDLQPITHPDPITMDTIIGYDYQKQVLLENTRAFLVYLSPDQELYLQIVAGMAEKEGIRMGSEDLRRRAIQWELNHQGRSGRSARQFIDDLLRTSKIDGG